MWLWDAFRVRLDGPTDALFWRNVPKTYLKCYWQALGWEIDMVKRNSHFHSFYNFWMIEEWKQIKEIVLKKKDTSVDLVQNIL